MHEYALWGISNIGAPERDQLRSKKRRGEADQQQRAIAKSASVAANVPGWRWKMKTSKSKYRSAPDFDLTRYNMLYPLLTFVPHDQRSGSIIKGEGGLPVRYRSFVKWWRKIANAAGLPSDVESMDLRASGATEALEAGVPIEDISAGMTHKRVKTTLGYIRRQKQKIADMADARIASRSPKNDSGTA